MLNMLSYLEAKDILAFSLCNKANRAFYTKNRNLIDFKFFLEKVVQDPAICLYLYNAAKKNHLLQKALIAFIDNGEIKETQGGYPYLLDLVGQYRQYVAVKKNIDSNKLVEKRINSDGTFYDIVKINDGNVYVKCGHFFEKSTIRIYNVKENKMTVLERCYDDINRNYKSFFNFCEIDEINNRFYSGVNASGGDGINVVSWDLSTRKIFKKFITESKSKCSSFFLDKEKLCVGGKDGMVTIFNTETAKILESSQVTNNSIKKLIRYRDYIASFSGKDNNGFDYVQFLDSNTLRCVGELRIEGEAHCSDKPIAGKFMFFDNDKGSYIYDISNVNDIKFISNINLHSDYIEKILPFGNCMFTFSNGNKIDCWSIIEINNQQIDNNIPVTRKTPGRIQLIEELTNEESLLCRTEDNILFSTDGKSKLENTELVIKDYNIETKLKLDVPYVDDINEQK